MSTQVAIAGPSSTRKRDADHLGSFESLQASSPSSSSLHPLASKTASSSGNSALATAATASGKIKTPRDSKRRATHSQIERRRREKINECLITLCQVIPACVREVQTRKQAERQDGDAQGDAAGAPATVNGEKGKRKRVRKRKEDKKDVTNENKEEELGLHKLEVLTHAIDYIYELKGRIAELEGRTLSASTFPPAASPAFTHLSATPSLISGSSTAMTSPIMSLSAESPILRRGSSSGSVTVTGNGNGNGLAAYSVSSNAHPGYHKQDGRRPSASYTNGSTAASPLWPMLPSSVLPIAATFPTPGTHAAVRSGDDVRGSKATTKSSPFTFSSATSTASSSRSASLAPSASATASAPASTTSSPNFEAVGSRKRSSTNLHSAHSAPSTGTTFPMPTSLARRSSNGQDRASLETAASEANSMAGHLPSLRHTQATPSTMLRGLAPLPLPRSSGSRAEEAELLLSFSTSPDALRPVQGAEGVEVSSLSSSRMEEHRRSSVDSDRCGQDDVHTTSMAPTKDMSMHNSTSTHTNGGFLHPSDVKLALHTSPTTLRPISNVRE